MGNKEKTFSEQEKKIRLMARKSIVSKVNIPKGTIIEESMICFKRPGNGDSKSKYRTRHWKKDQS